MSERELLLDLLQRYFDGLYRGNAELLRGVFHPQARLFGERRGKTLQRELEAYLRLVATRRCPMRSGEAQDMKVLALQVHGAIAMATVQCHMLGFNYLNLLGLLRQDDGGWRIVSKLYTDLEP